MKSTHENKLLLYGLIVFIIFQSQIGYSQKELSIGINYAPFYSSLGWHMNEDHLITVEDWNPRHNSRTYLRYGLGLSYAFQKNNLNHKIQLIVGHRYIHEIYEDLEFYGPESGYKVETEYNQVSYVLNYLFCGKMELGRFDISGGIGPSIQRIGKGFQKYTDHLYYYVDDPYQGVDSYNLLSSHEIKTGGGFGIGGVGELNITLAISQKINLGFHIQSYLTLIAILEPDHFTGSDGYSSWDYKDPNKEWRLAASRITPGFNVVYKLP